MGTRMTEGAERSHPAGSARTWLWILLVLAWALPAAAVQHELSILLDTDDDPVTGCTVVTSSGPFTGVEQVLVTTVDTVSSPAPEATVVAVARRICGPGNVLGASQPVDPGDWSVGLGLGVDGFPVVETFFPLAGIPPGAVLRAGVVLADEDGGEVALLTVQPGSPSPILIDLHSILEIPTLSQWGIGVLILLLALAAAVRLRRVPGLAALVAVLVLAGAGVAWAACVLDGDPGEWNPGHQVAEAPSAACLDDLALRAVFAQQDGDRLCLRVDACLRFNSPPVATPQAVSTPEDTAVPVVLSATDPDGDPITAWNVVSGPSHGVLGGTAPNLTYTPNVDYSGPDSFAFTASDAVATSAPATVNVTVTPVNDPPVVNAAAFAVAEDAAIGAAVGTVTFNDPDAGQTHTFAITAGNTGTAFAIHPSTGQITVAAALDFETLAAYALTVEVTDDGAPVLSGSATVDVTVTDVDDPPVAVDDAATVTEDDPATAIGVLANDTDVDGGPRTVQSVTQPAGGTVVITGGGSGVTYQPDPDFCNDGTPVDTFTYTLNGGSVGTVSVTVTCVDDPPVAVADAATVAEDAPATPVDVLGNDTDVDGGAISIASVTQPSGGTVVITGGGSGLTYQPDPDFCNDGTPVDTFTYTLAPGASVGTVSVTVTCVDDAPLAVNDAATVAEDSGANGIAVLANDTDVDGGPISIASVTQPGNGTVAITGGGTGVSYTPNANYCNDGTPVDTFTYTLAPGASVGTVSVTVTCVDDAPVAVADAATVAEDAVNAPIDVLLNDVDLDGGPRTVTAVQSPTTAGGTVVITGGGSGVAYTPAANYCNNPPGTTPDTFTYTLNGGSNGTVSVTVNCVNDGPQVDLDADDSQGTGGSDYAVTFTEGDGTRLLQDPADPLGAVITDVDSTTLATLTVTLTNLLDAGEEFLDADVSAFAPAITKDYDTTTPGVGVLTITGPATIADFIAVLRTVTYGHTGDAPDTTDRVIHFVANDGTDDGNTAVSTVTVVEVDDPPVAVADAATVDEDSGANAIDVLGNDTDPDGGPISITAVAQPANGSVVITGGGTGVSYTPDANYCNDGTPVDTFTYTLSPGSSVGTVSVTVTCVDDAPVAVADAATVDEDSGANAIAVLANDTDADGGPISVALVTQPANGTVVITGGGTGVSYTPDANYCNSPPGSTLDTFTYTLSPGGSSTSVTVTVTCVDDGPVAVADAATVVEDSGANAIAVLANDTDVDGGAISIASVTQPASGTVVITGGGTGLTYAPAANYCNNPPGSTLDTFTYTLTPGGSSTTVTVTVTCVDDPPVAVADATTVDEDSGANAIDVLGNDTDVDGGAISVTAVTQPANGTVAITGGGSGVSYTPDANFCNDPPGTTPETFTYTLTPGSSMASVSVLVNCINDPPVAGADSFETFGNTELRVDLAAAATPHVLQDLVGPSGVLNNDSDPVEGSAVFLTGVVGCADLTAPFDCPTSAGGRVILETDGSFTYRPPQADPAQLASSIADGFQYTIQDAEGAPATGTVTFTVNEVVWYVDPAAAPGGDGRSHAPFQTLAGLAGAGGVGDLDNADDYILVHDGAFNGSIELEAGQRLLGEGVGLSLVHGSLGTVQLLAAGTHPQVTNAGGDVVTVTSAVPARIAGLSLSAGGNAVGMNATGAYSGAGTLAIENNVFRGAGAEGIDFDGGATGTLTLRVRNNSWNAAGTHGASAVDVRTTAGDVRLDLGGNAGLLSTNPAAAALWVDANGGTLTVTGFAANSVHPAAAGAGMVVSDVRFDAVPGGGFDRVQGGATTIGAPGDPVGGAGLVLTNVTGDLAFGDASTLGDLDVHATGNALQASSGLVGGVPQLYLQVRSTDDGGSAVLNATGGAALDLSAVGGDLRLSQLVSSNGTRGVSLVNFRPGSPAASFPATFRAPTGSSITTNNAAATAFRVDQSNASVTYGGTVSSTAGRGVHLTANTGSTLAFSGTLTLSTGTSPAFEATGGGTVTATGSASTLATTTATALNVANTIIGGDDLVFRSISSDGGGSSGIVLNNTGGLGGLTVAGTGAPGSGGTIRNKTVDGIFLVQTRDISLSHVVVDNNDGSGIFGDDVTDFSLLSSSVTNNADTTGGTEAGLRFNELLGNCAITNSTISGSVEDNIRITPDTGVLSNLAISGSTIGPNNALTGGSGLALVGTGTAQVTVNVTATVFTGNRASGILTSFTDDAAHTVNVSTSTFQNHNTAIDLGVELNADLTFTVNNNATIVGNTANAINIVSGTGATNGADVRGTIQGNTIGDGIPDSGSQNAFGIAVDLRGDVDAVLSITNNTVRNTDIEGIFVQSRLDADADGEVGLIDLTVRDNTVQAPDDNSAFPFGFVYGTRIESRNTSNLCLDIAGNTSAGTGGAEGFRVRQRDTSTFRAERLTLGAQTAATMQTFVAAQNDPGSTASTTAATSFTGVADGTCRNP